MELASETEQELPRIWLSGAARLPRPGQLLRPPPNPAFSRDFIGDGKLPQSEYNPQLLPPRPVVPSLAPANPALLGTQDAWVGAKTALRQQGPHLRV